MIYYKYQISHKTLLQKSITATSIFLSGSFKEIKKTSSATAHAMTCNDQIDVHHRI